MRYPKPYHRTRLYSVPYIALASPPFFGGPDKIAFNPCDAYYNEGKPRKHTPSIDVTLWRDRILIRVSPVGDVSWFFACHTREEIREVLASLPKCSVNSKQAVEWRGWTFQSKSLASFRDLLKTVQFE